MQVPVVRTVCTPREFARAAVVAWRALYGGTDPTQAQVGVLYAHWMMETGGRSCWNWNIGNVKVTQGQVDAGVEWIDLAGTWEVINGERVVLPSGDPGKRFRAFPSLAVAMTEHLAFLRNKRYAPSWPHVESGDASAFAYALKRQGYYTGSEIVYATSMARMHAEWMRMSAFDAAVDQLDEVDTQPEIPHHDFRPPYVLPDPIRLDHPSLDDDPPDDAA